MPALTFRHTCYAVLAVTAVLPACALADSAGTYLTWQNKATPASESRGDDTPATMAYPAPPSPYGQVGDPFRRNLNWPAKQTPQVLPQPAPKPEPIKPQASESPRPYQPVHAPPAAVAPAQTVASRPETPKSVTVQPLPPAPAPQAAIVAPTPPPPPVLSVAKPTPAPRPPESQTASVSAPTPLPAAKPVTVTPQAVAAAPKPQNQTQTLPQSAPAAQDNGYQVPATSKYAAQIRAARAAQAKEQARDLARQKAEEGATAPEPSEQLAVHETDHVFIPGETYKDAGDAPRLYSLHRMYGLQPDPITVSPETSGTILDGADLHADEAAPKTPAKDPAKESGQTAKAKPEGK
jgi:hypothetical protein